MAEYDLTTRFCKFLDPHLTFPLLEYINTRGIYSQNDVLGHILDTVSKTNMLDYTVDTRNRLNLDKKITEEMLKRKPEIIAKLKNLKSDVAPIVSASDLLKQGGEIAQDSRSFLNALQRDFNFQPEHLESAYKLAKYLYECGNYNEAGSYLYFCQIVMSPDDKNYLSMLWGKLASEILTLNWNAAMEDMVRLRTYIDEYNLEPIRALQQRSWLIHWAVLIFFNHPKGREELIRMFLYNNIYLNTIQTVCPHILRYMVASVLIKYTARDVLNDVVKIVEQESYEYRDPITEFIERLLVDFDFEAARGKLFECQQIILNDFFLESYLKEFVSGARMLIFETYCRLHKKITIAMLAEKLSLSSEETERWIVKMIRDTGLNAKIDSKNGHIDMIAQPPQNDVENLAKRIEALMLRSDHLTDLIERLVNRYNSTGDGDWKYVKEN